MNRIAGMTVLVTGASAGIGEACARAFASRAANLVLVARRRERLEALKEELESEHGVAVRIEELDVTDRSEVELFVERLEAAGEVPDVLVNNAGKAKGLAKLHEGQVEHWEEMVDTNVKGLLYVTRAVLPRMVERDRGHVVNIGSIAGRMVYPGGNVYNATKFAVRALSQAANVDLVGTSVRMSSVDPGLVETEFSEVRFDGDVERAETVYEGYRPLQGEDIAEAVCWVVDRPEHVNVQELLIMPTDQRNPYVLHTEDDA